MSWTGPIGLLPNAQGSGFQGNTTSSSSYQRPSLQGAYNAPRRLPQLVLAQSYYHPICNKIDKVTKRVNYTERMMRCKSVNREDDEDLK